MTSELVLRYRAKLMDLELSHPLSEEEEDRRLDELDVLWWSMSQDEHQIIEEDATFVPPAPQVLGMTDNIAKDGVTPRHTT